MNIIVHTMKHIGRILVWASAGFLILIMCTTSIFTGILYTRVEEIGLDTAQKRYSKVVCFIPVDRQVKPTYITELLEVPAGAAETQWRTVNTFAWNDTYSPYYRFHSAFNELAEIEILSNTRHLTPKTRKYLAQKMIESWRANDSPQATRHWGFLLHTLNEEKVPTLEEVQAVILADAPKPKPGTE